MIKRLLLYILLAFSFVTPTNAQYYLRGAVKDEKQNTISNAKIFLHSSRQQFTSGSSGDFGIPSKLLFDSVTISMDGYETKSVKVKTDTWQDIVVKISHENANKNKPKLISVTKNLNNTEKVKWFIDEETYFQIVENDYVNAEKFPNTGFSLNVNKASYSNVRRFINMKSTVPPDAVRTEELINYFNLHYSEPAKNDVFKVESQLTQCPWNNNKQLLYVNINAKKLELEKTPPGNFVFLVDASGSMDMPNKLPLLKAAFQMFVKNLRPIDTVSIVIYGGTVAVWMQPTGGAQKDTLIKRFEELEAMGDTPGEAAILMAYRLAENTFIKDGNNRVILATDGDFNVGIASEKELDELITKEKQKGVYLTCLGVGMGNFKDSKLETLAKSGNGNYAYLDNLHEAEKVLVKELSQTFYGVADDVYFNIQFNPAVIKNYRLVGFDNKRDAVADSTTDLEGGEVGSGNSVMAMFEVELNDTINANEKNVAKLDLRYSNCNDTAVHHLYYNCKKESTEFSKIHSDYQFAAAVTMFGLKLKQSKYINEIDWLQIETLATASHNPSNYLHTDFLQVIHKAKDIYLGATSKKKKKKKDDD
ncbi:MAG: von Willebrand factor type A domain-containing protein [Ferruginibacter sp.]|nr:von Willebrand factor type A domain-containing protein [Ferruginibacter sp.]